MEGRDGCQSRLCKWNVDESSDSKRTQGIQIALFITVITSLIGNVITNLTPDPSLATNALIVTATNALLTAAGHTDLSLPAPDSFEPPVPSQITFMFYFLALIISVSYSLFCYPFSD